MYYLPGVNAGGSIPPFRTLFDTVMTSENLKIEFDLMSNAIDSLERSIDLLAWSEECGEARRFKQAILNVSHGIELLLKERLRRVHPALIWENVDKYPSLSARTVGVDTAIVRLINIGGVIFSDEDISLIRSLRNKRNAIEHFSWSITANEANAIVGSALSFAVFFSKINLNYEFFGYSSKDDDTFSQLMAENHSFACAYRRYHDKEQSLNIDRTICEFCNGVGVNSSTGICNLCDHVNWEHDDFPF